MRYGQHNMAVIGTTPEEAVVKLERAMGLAPDLVTPIETEFPATRNTSAGELRRMHEEAEMSP